MKIAQFDLYVLGGPDGFYVGQAKHKRGGGWERRVAEHRRGKGQRRRLVAHHWVYPNTDEVIR